MCNLSERIEEIAYEKAYEKATEKVTEEVKKEDAIGMIRENISDEVIHRLTKLPLDKIAELRKQEMCLAQQETKLTKKRLRG